MGCINSTDAVRPKIYEYKGGTRAECKKPLETLTDEELAGIPETGYLYDGLFVKFRVKKLYDGDTITIVFDIPDELGGGRACRGYRIRGYDAPEMKQSKKPPSGIDEKEWENIRHKNKVLATIAKLRLKKMLKNYDAYAYIEETPGKTHMNYGRLFGDILLFPRGHTNPRIESGTSVSETMLREVKGCYPYGGATKKTPEEIAVLYDGSDEELLLELKATV